MSFLYIHLDLGIGGAENLILNLAQSHDSPLAQTTTTTIYTTHCSQSHCFAVVKNPDGVLASSVKIRGNWIPRCTPFLPFLRMTAIWSHIRVLYLTLCLIYDIKTSSSSSSSSSSSPPITIIVDVLPTPCYLLKVFCPSIPVLYYCHFPDKLITETGNSHNQNKKKNVYRRFLDYLEDSATPFADLTLVNSLFTKGVFLEAFNHHRPPVDEGENDGNIWSNDNYDNDPSDPDFHPNSEGIKLHQQFLEKSKIHNASKIPDVLYPPIDLNSFTPPTKNKSFELEGEIVIVSMNRFEVKKNVSLAIYALKEVVELAKSNKQLKKQVDKVKLVIAGGYDPQNSENIRYLEELKKLAKELGVEEIVDFRTSVSDEMKAELFTKSLCALYTPKNEHFGIVPLEVCFSGTPVIACNSGGPKETVIDGVTGFLCEQTPGAFAEAIVKLLLDEKLSCRMGVKGNEHVRRKFGLDKMKPEYERCLRKCRLNCAFNLEFANAGVTESFVTGLFFVFAGVTCVCIYGYVMWWILQAIHFTYIKRHF